MRGEAVSGQASRSGDVSAVSEERDTRQARYPGGLVDDFPQDYVMVRGAYVFIPRPVGRRRLLSESVMAAARK